MYETDNKPKNMRETYERGRAVAFIGLHITGSFPILMQTDGQTKLSLDNNYICTVQCKSLENYWKA